MNNIFNSFDLLKENLDKKVTLNALLIITNNECYLVPNGEDDNSPNRIEVYYPNLEALLDEAVGGWVGSNVTYFDDVKITGILKKGTIFKNPLSISEIVKFTLIRDGDEYKIL